MNEVPTFEKHLFTECQSYNPSEFQATANRPPGFFMQNTTPEDSEVSQVSMVGQGMLTVKEKVLNNPRLKNT